MEISEAVRAAHLDLSPVAGQFLDHALATPEMLERLEFTSDARVPGWARSFAYELQSWPVFIGAEKLREIARATVGITQLARNIPARVFNNDARRITKFYGWDNEAIAALLLVPPNGLDGALARCDFIDGDEGLKCVEINGSASLGGWQLRFYERSCRESPALASFLAAAGVKPFFRDPWHAAFTHMVGETLRAGIASHGELNLAVVLDWEELTQIFKWDRPLREEFQRDLARLYVEVLASIDSRLRGEILCCDQYGRMTARGGSITFEGRTVHAILEGGREQTPPHVYRCFKACAVGLYNGPLSTLLSDKRNLALLSLLEETDLLSEEERALVRDHVPWSREVSDTRTTWRGESVSLLDFARTHRESLVLKPAGGRAGIDVYIGSQTPPAEWAARVEQAAAGRGYLLQELVRSKPYLFQHGPAGCTVHDLVWGTFCFGDQYGGGFLRVMPSDHGPSVINAARGASEAFLFEV